jgi:hypothetical protein
LPNENADEYTSLLESYVEDLQPTGPIEMNAKWFQRRLNNIETHLFEQQMEKQKEDIEKVYDSYNESVEHAFAFRRLSETAAFQMWNRMHSRLERTYSRALRDLPRLRQFRESKLALGKQNSEKRTESQDRSPAPKSVHNSPAQTTRIAAASGIDPA